MSIACKEKPIVEALPSSSIAHRREALPIVEALPIAEALPITMKH
jgi:hypothetical protein